MTNTMKAMLLLAGLGFAVAGCNPFESERAAAKRADERQQMEADRMREEQARSVKALTEYVRAKAKLLSERSERVEKELALSRGDVAELSRLIGKHATATGADGKDLKPESKLLRQMRDSEINALAKKWLATDFSLIREDFVQLVRQGLENDARYRKALAQSDANYEAVVKETHKWTEATQTQRDEEIARLQREIKTLETRRIEHHKNLSTSTRNTIVGNKSAQERERRDKLNVLQQKVQELDNEIGRKRQQVDFLRNPSRNQGLLADATSRSRNIQSRADDDRRQAFRTVNDYIKPKQSVSEIVMEYSRKTIGKLQSTIAAKVKEGEEERDALARKLLELNEIVIQIPVLEASEFRKVRQRVDKVSILPEK